ncbi:ADP-ribose diphosphatase [Enterovibrio norvegicus]|uniref:ADP-ribose pyrophosphatase n=2 Tax=Enterovibrio norvegicus TaxID=188144 RepID=A0A1I5T891_9GAMM|nr:ADP-ribose diphosphatase [Enterovibrio norvegicus]MCC4800523.1 ADP-ribose diphosphatase [Enterovibrio norvegicus]OEE51434.1 ADP-ribose diphosphatase [Enterovibrio norvegicus]OEF54663.1 ADP-ribose diphosphatase [Enterovibrio norvegicus]OEF59736.1 ADP-ribose diphosphatase [Enterovibrio norvegicus]PMI32187.1 ADP-ribose diphosphatase [Enterovibrio norvegicus]
MEKSVPQKMQPNQFGHEDVQIDKSDLVYNGYFKMVKYRFRHRLFAGGWSDTIERELFERGQAVAMLPYDPVTDSVVLVEQIRIGAMVASDEPWQLEIVAGIIDKDESPEDVAVRESEEEAGLPVQELTPITSYLSTSGGCSERIHLYLGKVDASKAKGIHGLPEEGEDILVHVVPRETAYQWVQSGKIENAASIIALQWLMLNVETLRE